MTERIVIWSDIFLEKKHHFVHTWPATPNNRMVQPSLIKLLHQISSSSNNEQWSARRHIINSNSLIRWSDDSYENAQEANTKTVEIKTHAVKRKNERKQKPVFFNCMVCFAGLQSSVAGLLYDRTQKTSKRKWKIGGFNLSISKHILLIKKYKRIKYFPMVKMGNIKKSCKPEPFTMQLKYFICVFNI